MAPPVKSTGNALVNASTGEKKWFPQHMLKEAIVSGEWAGVPGDRMYLLDGSGNSVAINAGDSLQAFLELGYNAESKQNIRFQEKEVRLDEKYGDSNLRAFGETALSTASFGGYDWLATKLGASAEGLRERRERAPGWVTGTATGIGIVGPALFTGGGSVFAKAAAGGAKGAVGLGAKGAAGTWVPKAVAESTEYAAHVAAAKEAGKGFFRGRTVAEKIARVTPAGMADVLGQRVGRALLPAGEAVAGGALAGEGLAALSGRAILGKALVRTGQFGAEGIPYGIGHAISVATLNEDPITAEAIWSEARDSMLLGAAFGGGLQLLGGAGHYLWKTKARRLQKLDELTELEKPLGQRKLELRKENYVAKELAKMESRRAGEDVREAAKGVTTAERAETRAQRGREKERTAAQKDLDKQIARAETDAAAKKDAYEKAKGDVAKTEAKIEKLERQAESEGIRAKKGEAQLELAEANEAADKAKRAADEVSSKEEALKTERLRQEGEITAEKERAQRHLDDLREQHVRLEEAERGRINEAAGKRQALKDEIAELEAEGEKLQRQAKSERTKLAKKKIDRELRAANAELARVEADLATAGDAIGKGQQDRLEEIAEATLAPAEDGGDKLRELLAVLRNNAEAQRGTGYRMTSFEGGTVAIDEMDELIRGSTREIHEAIKAFDHLFMTQEKIGSPYTRVYVGKKNVDALYKQDIHPTEAIDAPRFGRSILVDQKYMDDIMDAADDTEYVHAIGLVDNLEKATIEHARNLELLRRKIGYDVEGAVGAQAWPKTLQEAHGVNEFTSGSYIRTMRIAKSGHVMKIVKRMGKNADEVVETSEQAAARANVEKIAGEQKRIALDAEIEAIEAQIAKIKGVDEKILAVDARRARAVDALKMDEPAEMTISAPTVQGERITVPAVTAEKPWYVAMVKSSPRGPGHAHWDLYKKHGGKYVPEEALEPKLFSTDEVNAMIAQGKLNTYDSVWGKGFKNWQAIHRHFELDPEKAAELSRRAAKLREALKSPSALPGKVEAGGAHPYRTMEFKELGEYQPGRLEREVLEGKISEAEEVAEAAGQRKVDLADLEKQLEEKVTERLNPTKVEEAQGALNEASKLEVYDVISKRLDDQRAKYAQRDDLVAAMAKEKEELNIAEQEYANNPSVGQARVWNARARLKEIQGDMDRTVENSADVLTAKKHLEQAKATRSAKELKRIAAENDHRFGRVEEGGVGDATATRAAKKRTGKVEQRESGLAGDAVRHGLGNVAYHGVASRYPGWIGKLLASMASTLARRAGRSRGKGGKPKIDIVTDRARVLKREKAGYLIGAFLGPAVGAVKVPSYATATQAMLDSMTFMGDKPKIEKVARLTSVQQSYYNKVKELRSLMTNPEALMNTITDATAELRALSPQLASKVADNEFKRIMYIASKIPQTPPMGYAGTRYDEHIPADSTIAKFARQAFAAYEPLSALAKLAKGTLTHSEAEALRETSPETFLLVQEEFVERLNKKGAKRLPFAKRIQMSVLFGVPADTVMSAIQKRQSIFTEEEQQPQPQVDLSQMKQTAQNQETNTQRRAAK